VTPRGSVVSGLTRRGPMWQVYNSVRQAATDMNALTRLQCRQPQIQSMEGALPLTLSGGRVTFDNVHFGYGSAAASAAAAVAGGADGAGGAEAAEGDAQPLLRGVSFAVEAGQTVAIVGGSGSGKSSILRLLCRFYDPTAGSISIDGQVPPPSHLPPDQIRSDPI
jgi:ABC-type multidrug transport system fused ATPase/permease subunit